MAGKFINYIREGIAYDEKEMLVAKGHLNRPGVLLDNGVMKAVIIHYTANDNAGADAVANAKYFGRAWQDGKYIDSGKLVSGPIEATTTKARDLNGEQVQAGTAFRYGSAHIICDMKQVVVSIPHRRGVAEAAWGCGDRAMPYDDLNKGYKPIARELFNFRQNYQTISVEICNNDVIPNSDVDWDTSVLVVISYVKKWLIADGYWVSTDKEASSGVVDRSAKDMVRLFRHHDITGKMCPLPLVDNENDWDELVQLIAGPVNFAYDKAQIRSV